MRFIGDRRPEIFSMSESIMNLDHFLRGYYVQAGFEERGEIDAPFPAPVGTLRLLRYERQVRAQTTPEQK